MASTVQSSARCQKQNLAERSECLQSQPHMENVIVIMQLTEFWSQTLFLSLSRSPSLSLASTPFLQTRKL